MGQVAVVGAGWSGLAAAVQLCDAGHQVALFEMSKHLGGRARSGAIHGQQLDNGQHIMIGAYGHALALLRRVGVDPGQAMLRMPLELRYVDGPAFALPKGHPSLSFARAVLSAQRWRMGEKLSFLRAALGWRLSGFSCAPDATVQALCSGIAATIVRDLIEPLCVAALNTPMQSASGQVFLRVMRDALFSGVGSADLLLSKHGLSRLLPDPARAMLLAAGARVTAGHRVMNLQGLADQWLVDGERFDAVVLATTPREAARLVLPIHATWSQLATTLPYQPIVTVWLADGQLKWPTPMMAFQGQADSPAQFALALEALTGPKGVFTWIVSGAASWLDKGLQTTAEAVLVQARSAFPGSFTSSDAIVHVAAERRATLACVPGLVRPGACIAKGLFAAGDYVDGPYPSTLEGAVRSGGLAAALAHEHLCSARPTPT